MSAEIARVKRSARRALAALERRKATLLAKLVDVDAEIHHLAAMLNDPHRHVRPGQRTRPTLVSARSLRVLDVIATGEWMTVREVVTKMGGDSGRTAESLAIRQALKNRVGRTVECRRNDRGLVEYRLIRPEPVVVTATVKWGEKT